MGVNSVETFGEVKGIRIKDIALLLYVWNSAYKELGLAIGSENRGALGRVLQRVTADLVNSGEMTDMRQLENLVKKRLGEREWLIG
jgi:hypothetical protein